MAPSGRPITVYVQQSALDIFSYHSDLSFRAGKYKTLYLVTENWVCVRTNPLSPPNYDLTLDSGGYNQIQLEAHTKSNSLLLRRY